MSAIAPMEDDDAEEGIEVITTENEAFEREYYDDFSWEQLQEDEHGRLRPLDRTLEQRKKRQRLLTASQQARIRRGMIRYMQLVVDLSAAASAADFRPTRLAVMVEVIQSFIREFFDQNPLSHLGIILIRNGVAEVLTELSSSPDAHLKELKNASLSTSGPASLQNALTAAVEPLRQIPSYGFREVLIMFASLSTCDPGEITETIKATKVAKTRVSIVGLAAEVFICREVADQTGGTYGVALNETHLNELMIQHAPPPPAAASVSAARLVRMGFPQRNAEDASGSAFVGASCTLRSGGFTCPRCSSRVEELPCECHICGLTLVSSPHLARSYHHLFPIKAFVELHSDQIAEAVAAAAAKSPAGAAVPSEQQLEARCYGCGKGLGVAHEESVGNSAGVVVQCSTCWNVFCFDCDAYIHESLHNCPGCECQPDTSAELGGDGDK